MNNDLVNGIFLAIAGLMVLDNVRLLLRDREVRGASIMAAVFFFLFALWNLHYYPPLGQWWSFAGGVLLMIANCLCMSLMVYYSYFVKTQRTRG